MTIERWQQAKAALSTALKTVSITLPPVSEGGTPVTQGIRQAFTTPPASLESADLPCVVMGQSTLDDEWASGLAQEMYELTCTLLLRDADAQVEIAEAYRGALKDKLRRNVSLSGTASVVNGASFTELGDIEYSGARYTGFQFTLPIVISVPVEFGGGWEDEEVEP